MARLLFRLFFMVRLFAYYPCNPQPTGALDTLPYKLPEKDPCFAKTCALLFRCCEGYINVIIILTTLQMSQERPTVLYTTWRFSVGS